MNEFRLSDYCFLRYQLLLSISLRLVEKTQIERLGNLLLVGIFFSSIIS